MSNLSGVKSIDAGSVHSLALKTDGMVWGWGSNYSGQLGADAVGTTSYRPVQVYGLADIKAVATSGNHNLVLKSDGTVYAWGSNIAGKLGDGTTTNRPTPVKVSGLTDVVDVEGGEFHSLAAKNDGTLWAWGVNFYGELGDGTTPTGSSTTATVVCPPACSATPVRMSDLTDVKDVARGYRHTLTLAEPKKPANDNFANSHAVSGTSTSVPGTTRFATREAGEPNHYTSNPADADRWVGDHSVWYRWTAPEDHWVSFDTCDSGGKLDSIIAVYEGGSLNNLSRVDDNNNDDCGGGWGAKVTFEAVAGTTYYIAVSDVGGLRENTFNLNLSLYSYSPPSEPCYCDGPGPDPDLPIWEEP